MFGLLLLPFKLLRCILGFGWGIIWGVLRVVMAIVGFFGRNLVGTAIGLAIGYLLSQKAVHSGLFDDDDSSTKRE